MTIKRNITAFEEPYQMTTRAVRLFSVLAFLFAIAGLPTSAALAQSTVRKALNLRGFSPPRSGPTRGVRRTSSRFTAATLQPTPDAVPEIDSEIIGSEIIESEIIESQIIDDETIFSESDLFGYQSATPSFWARAEYLLWWTKGMDVPALATTGPTTQSGALGESGTSVVFGDAPLNEEIRSGGRLTLGFSPWNNPSRSVEVNYMALEQESSPFTATHPTGMILARPFFNVQPATGNARQDAQLVSDPTDLRGVLNIQADTDFQSGEVLLRQVLIERSDYSLDFLLGYRFTRLDDSLLITENLAVTGTGNGQTVGTTINLYDLFDTENSFHGADFGFAASYQQPGWSFDLLMKLALGSTRSTTTIGGSTSTTVPGSGTAVSTGGLLALASNIGRYQEDSFTAIPELGATFRFQISPRVQASVGYSMVYWSKVLRAGDQIDFDVNPTQLPPGPFAGAPRPEHKFTSTDFWAQGINFGLEFVY